MGNISMDCCEVFCCAARNKSFTAAAQQLFISQPAVTYKISLLEEQLDCQLFVRSSRGVSLTYEGELLYQACDPAFAQIDNALHTISQLKSLNHGLVRVGVSNTVSEFMMKNTSAAFSRLYPGIAVSISKMDPEILKSSLKAGWIDFAVLAPALLPPYNNKDTSDLQGLTRIDLRPVQDSMLAGAKYAHLANKILSVDELSRLPLILPEVSTKWKDLYQDQLRPDHEFRDFDILINGAEPRTALARGNYGITPFPAIFSRDEINAGTLVSLNSEIIPSRYDAHILTDDSRRISYAADRYLNMLLEEFKLPD